MWTGTAGEGRDIGNAHKKPHLHIEKVCPDGAYVDTIKGGVLNLPRIFTSYSSVGGVTMRCSDGTLLGTLGNEMGADVKCPGGFNGKRASAGHWVHGVTFGCNGGTDVSYGDAGGGEHACPPGYAISGISGQWNAAVGSIRYQCVPRTDDALLKCCTGVGANCREYTPKSGHCDAFMRSWCDKNPNDPKCSCLKSKLPLPHCIDIPCQQQGYKTQDADTGKCPPLTYFDCKQIVDIAESSNIDLANTGLALQCGNTSSSSSSSIIPVIPVIPSIFPPAGQKSIISGIDDRNVYIGGAGVLLCCCCFLFLGLLLLSGDDEADNDSY
jgi:hypothetical protein